MCANRVRDDVLEKHHVLVPSDGAFQRRARLLQALWREEHDFPIGMHRGRKMGSRIEADHARSTLANFLTDGIREVVRHAIGDGSSDGQLIEKTRLFENLLSSQPLAFNAFGELKCDLALATKVLQGLWPQIDRVGDVSFEHSPGRGDDRFTGDRSAFDVFVRYTARTGARGFLGIEVKYHEGLRDDPATHRARYEEVAEAMRCFRSDRSALRAAPLQQIWRDHLLAGSLIQDGREFDEGAFVFVCPSENAACMNALARYREHLEDGATFHVWTLESFSAALQAATSASWVADLKKRYLAFHKVDACAV